jgi:hypothetical protein
MDAAVIQDLVEAIRGLQGPDDVAGVKAVSLKLPEFWTVDPEIWFVRIESMFNNRGITQDATKFDYVVSALDNRTSAEVKSILLNPPPAEKYKSLRSALLDAFGKTQSQKDAQLLSLSGLGDKSPSALLRQIRSLNSDAETLRRALFLQQLPMEVRSVLAGLNIDNLDDLAKAADRIVEARQISQDSAVFAVSSSASRTSHDDRRRPQLDASGDSRICFYHSTYGPRAHKCQPGCLFASLTRSKPTSTRSNAGNGQAGR